MLQVQRTLSISINLKNPKGEEIIKSALTVFSLMEHKMMMHLTTGDRFNQTPARRSWAVCSLAGGCLCKLTVRCPSIKSHELSQDQSSGNNELALLH